MTMTITRMINIFHYKNSSRHNATDGCFIGHLNAAYFSDKLEDLHSDFLIKMLSPLSQLSASQKPTLYEELALKAL